MWRIAAQPEFVYDFHMQLLGVREVAEKELHVFFSAVRVYALKHPRVRLFALFCGIPLTRTASTRHGTFNLDEHLRFSMAEKKKKRVQLESDMGVMGENATVTLLSEEVSRLDAPSVESVDAKEAASGADAADAGGGEGGVGGEGKGEEKVTLSVEKEAAIEREFTAPDAVAFYLKVRAACVAVACTAIAMLACS